MNRHAISKINTFNLINNSNGSYVQFGDFQNINAYMVGLAVMQTTNKVSTNAGEPMFDQYDIFSKQFKDDKLVTFPYTPVNVEKPLYLCELPDVEVEKQIKHINITIASNSATILIGNGKRRYAQSRQKNIRQHL